MRSRPVPCASVYEAPFNYLVDYSFVNGFTPDPAYAQLLGLDAAGETIFYYQYGPTAIAIPPSMPSRCIWRAPCFRRSDPRR